MDNISFGFTLDDGMTSGLKSITEALAGIINYLEDVDKSIEGVDKKNFDTLKKNVAQACSSIDQIGQEFEEAGAKAAGLNKTNLNNVSKTASKVSQSIGDISSVASDSAANLNKINDSNMRAVTSTAESAASAMDELGSETLKAGQQISGISKSSGSFSEITRSIDSLDNGLKDVIEDINRLDVSSFSGNIAKTSSSLDQVGHEFDEAKNKAVALNKTSLNNVLKTADRVSQSVGDIGNEAVGSAASLKQINGSNMNSVTAAAQEAAQAVDKLGDETQETGNELSGISEKLGGITRAVGGIVATYASIEGVKKALDWSDSISQTTSRLNLVNQSFNEINGSQQTTAELQDQIFKAAQASRGSYSSLQNLVASLGNNAKDAFSNTEEMVTFATNLNKTFAISGASSEEMANATLQLTQGLAAGALRGDELNSVLENAPELINVIANSMGVPRGEIRDLAAEGKITAEVVKNALINSSNEINAKFQNMDVTFSQLWTQFTNTAQHAFQPVAQELSKLASSGEFQASMENLGDAVANLAPTIAEIVGKIASFAPQGLDLLVNSLKWVIDNAGAVSAGVISIAAATKAIEFKNTHAEEIGKFVDLLKVKLKGNSEAFNAWGQQATQATSNLASAFMKIVPDSLITKTTQVKTGLLNMASTASSAVASKFKVLTSGIGNFTSSIAGSITNTKLFTKILSPMGNILGGAASGMLALLKPLLSFGGIAGIVVAGVGLIAAALGAFNQGGNLSAGINSFFTNFTKSASDFGVMAVRAINTFAAKIPEVLPVLIQRGIELVNSLIRGISTALPAIMQTAVNILSALVQGIASNLPLIVQGGIDFLSGLINAISTNLPMLMQSGIEIISQLLSSITANLPRIIDAGVQALKSLISGIAANLPVIIQTGLQVMLALINGLVQNLPQIIQAGITLVTSLVDGLLQATPAILSGAWQIITTLGQALWDNRVAIWNTLVELGSNIVEGIKQGLIVAWNGITGWIGEKFNGLIDWVKSIFGIASPSTVFADIGSNLLQGFWNGLQSIWNGLSGWLSGVWDSITSLFSGGGDQNESVIDYTATIETTKAQIQELQEIVSQGFNNILIQIQKIMGQISAQTTAQFGTMTAAVLNQVNQMVVQTGSEILEITDSFNGVFSSLIAITGSALAALKAQTLSQVADMIAKMANTASGLNSVFLNAFKLMSIGTIQILENLNKGSISVLESLSKSAAAIMSTTRTNMVTTVTDMSESVISSYTYLRTQAISLISTMSSSLISIYQSLVSSIVALMTQMCNSIITLVQNLVKTLENTIGTLPGIFKSTGQQMMNSLKAGIDSNKASVVSTTSSLVEQLKTTFETGLGIHSPSDYMIWVGQMMLAGLINGMPESQVKKFAAARIESMKNSFKNGHFNADELVDYLGDKSLDVVKYLEVIGDQTLDESKGGGSTGIPPIVQEALKYVGYAPGGGNSMFGLHYGNPGAWCASFVRYCAEQVGVPFPATAWVPDVLDWSIATGRYTQTPQPGYAAIFRGGEHIEIVAGVDANGNVDMVGGNTGAGEVAHRVRNDATSYVALDGGHSIMTLKDTIMQAYNKKFNPAALLASSGVGQAYIPEAGVEQWRGTVQQALTMLGQPVSLTDDILYAINRESSGNPNAINLTDSNALAGHPSQGLLQTIPSTFAAYRNPDLPNEITNPLANIYAALNYMIQRYGSVANVVNPRRASENGWYGYEVGTRYVPQDMLAMIHKGEAILPAGQNPYSDSGGNYLSDMFNSIFSNSGLNYDGTQTSVTNTGYTQGLFDLEPTLTAEPVTASGEGQRGTNDVSVTLNVNQYITDSTDAKKVAKEAVDYLYDEINRQFYGTGGGVSLEY